MTPWRCFLCPHEGTARDRLSALVAFERHYIHTHYRPGRTAA